ncbi:trans-aconitate 2-methyltransferase [Nakamurella sp. YIM 132084]|uniref:Trans-aconitate 2-methyltransferase n=2 Tax=Nakamurella leprariae TaxID=2803911 RepID=A0A939C182_9ACTN|nr:trans-aconitate 2-methyltransferase [Nakamurella leprariae]MBM9466902.1 trans-aconitate 2-methyltransferase [Nakamurella leprariae]
MQWDPQRYLTFAGERARPFVDLIGRIQAEDPRTVVDLGCGPGNMTALLAQRWPTARVSGLDSSPEMIEQARREVPGIDFTVADLRDWTPPEPVDVLVSNAVLQWIPDHLSLLPRLVGALAPGGWLAFQVPGTGDAPSSTVIRELAAEAPYREHTARTARLLAHDPQDYLVALAGLGCRVDAWETTYLHVLSGPDPVFTWVSGTGARPVLQALPEELREPFTTEAKARLRAAYPEIGYDDSAATVLPFRRVFVCARRR